MQEVPCNLCASVRSRVRWVSFGGRRVDNPAYFAATTDKFGDYGTIRECRDCGLVYTSPRPSSAALLAGYEGNEDPDYARESDARCMNAYLSLAVLRRHLPTGRLLEVGCANGYFLNAARTSYEVVGVEPSRWARDHARKRLGIDIADATLEEARFADASFDVVAFIDVIEHVPDPLGMLREAARIVRPGGIVYLVTPDVESVSARVLGGRWWGLRPAHIYYFSRASMTRMLEKAGFHVEYARSYGRIFSWGYWLSRLSNYPRPIRAAIGAIVRALGIEDKFLYLDTRDSMQIIARRA